MSKEPKEPLQQVGLQDKAKKNSPVFPEGHKLEPVQDKFVACWFNGAQFSPGAQVCSGGRRIVCGADGYWREAGNC